jgi:hypothetical protein
MTWIHMTSTLANADDSFHSGVTSTLRNNILWAQQESRFSYHSIFPYSVGLGMSTTDYAVMDNWILFAMPARSSLGSPQPRNLTIVADVRLSTIVGVSLAGCHLQIAVLNDWFEPAVDTATGVLFHPYAIIGLSTSTYALYSDSVTPNRPTGNPYYFFAAAAANNDNTKTAIRVRGLYAVESAT